MRIRPCAIAMAWLTVLAVAAAAEAGTQPLAAGSSTVCQQWPGRPECGPYAEKYGTGPQTPWGPNFQKRSGAPTPRAPAPSPGPPQAQPSPPAETADCQASNAQTVVVLRTALDVARCIFSFYNTGTPIAIAKRLDVTVPTCVVLLSGTEPLNFSQATTLPEDIASALDQPEKDLYALAVLDAIFTLRNSGVCRQARLVLAGHSLGGMEAQNAAAFLLARQPGLSIGEIITFGSPATAYLSGAPPPRRFTTIGDPIPYTTVFTGTYRRAAQTTVSDLSGARRAAAIAKAALERYWAIGFGPGPVNFAAAVPWLAFGALGPHMQYPNTGELASYDALGNPNASGPGAVLRLQTLRRFQAKR